MITILIKNMLTLPQSTKLSQEMNLSAHFYFTVGYYAFFFLFDSKISLENNAQGLKFYEYIIK